MSLNQETGYGSQLRKGNVLVPLTIVVLHMIHYCCLIKGCVKSKANKLREMHECNVYIKEIFY